MNYNEINTGKNIPNEYLAQDLMERECWRNKIWNPVTKYKIYKRILRELWDDQLEMGCGKMWELSYRTVVPFDEHRTLVFAVDKKHAIERLYELEKGFWIYDIGITEGDINGFEGKLFKNWQGEFVEDEEEII